MLFLVICIGVLLIGLVALVLDKIFDHLYKKVVDESWGKADEIALKKRKRYRDAGEICIVIQYVGLIASAVLLSIFLIILMYFRVPVNTNYEDAVYEKQVLEYRLDNLNTTGNQVGNELLYNDIIEFNKKLRHEKRYVNNPWVNWFVNEKIAGLDYIEIEGLAPDIK